MSGRRAKVSILDILALWKHDKKEKIEFKTLLELMRGLGLKRRAAIDYLNRMQRSGYLTKERRGRKTFYCPPHEEDVIKAEIIQTIKEFRNDEVSISGLLNVFGVNLDKLTDAEKKRFENEVLPQIHRAFDALEKFKEDLFDSRLSAAWERHILNADIHPLVKWLYGYIRRWATFGLVHDSNAVKTLFIHALGLLERIHLACGVPPEQWEKIFTEILEELNSPKFACAINNFAEEYRAILQDFDPNRWMIVCFPPASSSWLNRHMFRLAAKFCAKIDPKIREDLKERGFLPAIMDGDKFEGLEFKKRLKVEEKRVLQDRGYIDEFQQEATVYLKNRVFNIFKLPDLRQWVNYLEREYFKNRVGFR